jgi:uncharacterized protein
MAIAETLYRLQLLDTDIDRIRRRVFEIDQAAKGSPALTHTRSELEKAQAAQRAAAAALAEIEHELSVVDAKIAAEDKRLYDGAIKNPKEMIEVQAEVESLRKRRAGFEMSQLERLDSVEQAEAGVQNCQTALRQAERQHADDTAHGKDERARLVKEVMGHAEKRAALVTAIPKPTLDQYNTIRAKRPNGVAVALIVNLACNQCGAEVSTSDAQQAHTGSGVIVCSNCGRMLYAM